MPTKSGPISLHQSGLKGCRRSFSKADGCDVLQSAAGWSYFDDTAIGSQKTAVGVDVKRLDLMVVTGRPKTTTKYIQATSRVGRMHPGQVCVVYNWSRPRDLSHYEQFEHYHATFYQQVEALSVTPALDRGLAALLTSYMHLTRTSGRVCGDRCALFPCPMGMLPRYNDTCAKTGILRFP
jgi:hypothetical protein